MEWILNPICVRFSDSPSNFKILRFLRLLLKKRDTSTVGLVYSSLVSMIISQPLTDKVRLRPSSVCILTNIQFHNKLFKRQSVHPDQQHYCLVTFSLFNTIQTHTHTMLLKRTVIKCSNILYRNISYVQRARLLEKIKNDDEFCKQSMEKGKFLLYSKGQPLLKRGAGPRDHTAHYVDYSYCDKVCRNV